MRGLWLSNRKTLNEAIATMGELDIAHQFCRRDGGRSQGKTGGGNQKTGKKGKQQKGSGGNPQQTSTSASQSQPVGKKGNKNRSQGKTQGLMTDKSKIQCYYCLNFGHKKSECKKFARDQKAKIGTSASAARSSSSSGFPGCCTASSTAGRPAPTKKLAEPTLAQAGSWSGRISVPIFRKENSNKTKIHVCSGFSELLGKMVTMVTNGTIRTEHEDI